MENPSLLQANFKLVENWHKWNKGIDVCTYACKTHEHM